MPVDEQIIGRIADAEDRLERLESRESVTEHVRILEDAATNGANTGSTAYVDMAGSNLVVTIPDGRKAYVFLIANMNGNNDTPRNWLRARIRCITDALDGPYSECTTGDGGFEFQTLNPMWLRIAQTGTKTYRIRWRVAAGGDTGTATQPYLYAIIVEYPSV